MKKERKSEVKKALERKNQIEYKYSHSKAKPYKHISIIIIFIEPIVIE